MRRKCLYRSIEERKLVEVVQPSLIEQTCLFSIFRSVLFIPPSPTLGRKGTIDINVKSWIWETDRQTRRALKTHPERGALFLLYNTVHTSSFEFAF